MITQGEHGVPYPFTTNNGKVLNLTGATVEVDLIKPDGTPVVKVAEILDAINGKCQFVLSSSDLSLPGTYKYQWRAFFESGEIRSNREFDFYVYESLRAGETGEISETDLIPFVRVTEFETVKADVEDLKLNGGGGGSVPSNVILFEDWTDGETVVIDTSTTPPADTTAPILTITAGGTFTGTKTVTLSANETADIFYTLDGSTPTTSSAKYTGPLSISATTTLKAFARDTAGNVSTVQTITYTLDTTAPADTTAPDNVTNLTATPTANSVALSWTASASSDVASYDIYNGSTLIANVTGTSYNVTSLTASMAYTFSVRAKDGANNVASGTTVTTTTLAPADTTAPTLTITPASTFADTQTVTMSANETATIWYTVDGSDPTTSGTRVQYTSPVTLTATTTVKAYAVDTAGNASAVQTVTYTKETAPTGGYVTSGLQVYYDFTKYTSTPTTIDDDSGNGNAGTVVGYNTAGTGIVDGEIVGDGTGDYITIPSKSSLKTYPFTLEFYVRVKNRATNPKTQERLLDCRYGSGTGNGVNVYLNNASHGTPNVIGLDGSLGSPSYTTSLAAYDDSYRHIVIAWGQTSQKIYVNGTLLATSSASSTSPLGDRIMYLFAAGNTTGDALTHGAKLFRFYNRELTQSEITQNYNDAIA